MKRKRTIALSAFVIVLFAGIFAARLYPFRVGQVTDFCYRRGHYWYGYTSNTMMLEDGAAWAVEAYEPTDMPGGPAGGPAVPWERRRPLSEQELRAFETLLVRDLRILTWPDETGPDPSTITDQDSWAVTFTYEGKEYRKTGYYTFPDGLKQIAAALSVPET